MLVKCDTPKCDTRNFETAGASVCSLFCRPFLLLDDWSSRRLILQDLEKIRPFEVVVGKIMFSLKISPELKRHINCIILKIVAGFNIVVTCMKNYHVCLNLGGLAGQCIVPVARKQSILSNPVNFA